MKKHWILLAIMTLCLVVGSAFAERRTGRRAHQPKRAPSFHRCVGELDLTEEQIAEITAIHQAAMEELKQAETPEEARAIIEQTHQAIKEVLTPEQLVVLQECLQPKKPVTCMDQIGLTLEQKEAINAIRKAGAEALKEAKNPEEARAIIEQTRQTIEYVLTEGQLAALNECRRSGKTITCMDQIDLTPEQEDQIDEIRQEAKEALKEAETPEEARAIIEQMHQAIENTLTEEQLEALRECIRPKKPVNCMDQIGLTPEQEDQMDAIRRDAMELLETAETREEIREIMNQMHEDLMSVLTDEQLAELQECRDAQRRHHRLSQGPEPEPEE